ncbi:unnamed protein product [Acanthoscelides obtectus]|uniref:Uncharacterized protein n=1 Tax=Acanthoscelides obtectus TaxID=200917 RepID=A0A9P0LNX3_ACAOB|nr:unnamed protein product [Acanthoscelides obtectus]CAK1671483.1 hypothetical protein AOBTE_LOCUS28265 [Acanthoscelides obtectus]
MNHAHASRYNARVPWDAAGAVSGQHALVVGSRSGGHQRPSDEFALLSARPLAGRPPKVGWTDGSGHRRRRVRLQKFYCYNSNCESVWIGT